MPTMEEFLGGLDPTVVAPVSAPTAVPTSDEKIVASVDMKPDQAAAVVQQGRRFDIPTSMIGDQPDPDLTRKAELEDVAKEVKASPRLDAYLGGLDPTRVAMVRDDVKNMGAIDQAVRFTLNQGKALYSGISRASAGIYGAVGAAGSLLPDVVGDPIEEFGAKWRKQIGLEADALAPASDNSLLQGWYSGLQSAGQVLASLPAAILSGNPALALAPITASVFGDSYGQAKDKGLGNAQSLLFGAEQAAVEYITERIPAFKLLEDLNLGSGVGKILFDQLKTEIPGEQLATFMQDFNEWVNLNPEKTLNEFLAERPEAALTTAVATIVGTGAVVGTSVGLRAGVRMITDDGKRAEDAKQSAEMLEQLNKLSSASQVRQRDMQTFESYVQSVADGSPVESVYISANALMQSGKAEKLAQLSPTVAEQLNDAIATGGDIRIPVAEVFGRLGDNAADRLPDLKTGPNEFTAREAEAYQKDQGEALKVQVEKILQDQSGDTEFTTSRDRVSAQITEKLNSLGRFTDPVNKIKGDFLAAYMGVQARNLGVTPEEFAAKYMPTFVGSEQAGIEQGGAAFQFSDELTSAALSDTAAADPIFLSDLANDAQGVMPGKLRRFDRSINRGEYSLEDVTSAWSKTRELIRAEHGDVVTLWRADAPADEQTGVTAYFGDESMARKFEDGGRSAKPYSVPVDDIVAVYSTEAGYQEIVVRRPDGGFKPNDSNILKQSARIKTGPDLFRNVIDALGLSEAEVKSTVIEFMTGLPGDAAFLPPTHVGGIPEVVRFLHTRRLASGLPVLDIAKPEDRTQLARLMAAEGLAAITSAGNALAWYDQTIRETLSQMGVKYPELNTNPHARNAFLIAMAITSQGMNVEANLGAAIELYDAYRLTVDANGVGQFPERGWGESASQMAGSLRLANKLQAEMGPDLLRRFLATPFTVAELNATGFRVNDELADELVLGSSVFGPKIGFGFYSNLTGNFDPVTMDMWFMRTKGRLAGDLPAMDPEKFQNQLARFRAGLKNRGKKSEGIFGIQLDKESVKAAMSDDAAAVALARTVNSMHQKDYRDNRALFDSGARQKSEIVLASGTIIQSMDKPNDAPTSGGERRLLRDVVQQATALVSEAYGKKVPSAAFQALIWYPEQELYSALGVKLPVTSQDYSGGARKILEAEGYNGQQLADARTAAQSGSGRVRSVDGQPDAVTAGVNGQVVGGAGPFTADERTKFLTERNARIIAEQRAAASGTGGQVSGGRLEQSGNGSGRTEGGGVAPLPGSPEVLGATGPDPRLVDVAAQYAASIGIDLKRQGEYARVDEARAARIADAYAAMPHAPQDPAVREAYQDLIKQTTAQYKALVDAGYKFWFMDPAQDPYAGNPWNAMRDLRANQSMAVFPTEAGFGTGGQVNVGLADPKGGPNLAPSVVLDALVAVGAEVQASMVAESNTEPTLVIKVKQALTKEQGDRLSEMLGQESIAQRTDDEKGSLFGPMAEKWGPFNPEYFVTDTGARASEVSNPLLANTGITWPYGSADGEMRPVLANDLFRAVHDAFGHGLEGAGFRAQGEENAWQSHIRLFTGSAVGALTSETRGQNSWLNFGPSGEKNRNAKVEDTVFADQKTGLMPEWTWTEDRVGDMQSGLLEQQARGSFDPTTRTLALLAAADLSTFFHESAHYFLDLQATIASQPGAPARVREDLDKLLVWQKVEGATPEERLANFNLMRDALNARIRGGLKQSVLQTETPEFKSWFGESKIVDEEGSPKILYHATTKDFEAFKPGGENENVSGRAIWFTDDASNIYAAHNIGGAGGFYKTGTRVLPVYLSLKNPLVVQAGSPELQALRQKYGQDFPLILPREVAYDVMDDGYDGVIFKMEGHPTEYIAFDSTQVKSAIANDGSFDPANPNILKQGGEGPSTNELADQAVRIHEAMAESFEQYLREGKAPSIELQGVFRTMRAWLKWVYKTVTDMYRVTKDAKYRLNDEVRLVFDRLLASDEEIAVARVGAKMNQLFETPEEAAKFGLDWEAYHKLAESDVDAAQEELAGKAVRDLKWLDNARSRMLKKLQAEGAEVRKVVRDRISEQVKSYPVYRAMRWLKTGEMTSEDGEEIKAEKGFRLNTDAIREMFPASGLDNLEVTALRGMTASDGLHPDLVAEMFGYSSGQQLIKEILAAQPMKDVVEGMTDQRMLEDHSELSDPQTMQESVNRAIYNQAHAKVLAAELGALEKALAGKTKTGTDKNGRTTSTRTLPKAAKEFAQALVARVKVKDLNPAKYEAAAKRAAAEATKAMKAGKLEDAATAKRNELVNNYAAQAAREAQAQITQAEKLFRKVLTGADAKIVKSRDLGLVNAARAVLSQFGFGGKAKSAMPYLELVRQYDPDTYNAVEASVRAAQDNAKPFETMTLEEVAILYNEIDALWNMARRMRVMEIDGNKLDREELATEINARLEDIGVPENGPGTKSAVTPMESLSLQFASIKAGLKRVEFWVDVMDGADKNGVFRRYIWNPIKLAADRYRADKVTHLRAFRAAFDEIAGTVKRGLIDAPELGYLFGKDSGGVALNEILHALLHTGNESNKRKLLLGRGWAVELENGTLDTTRWDLFLDRMIAEGHLTKQHFDFVQKVWDLLEQMKPGAQEAHRDAYGKYFDEVTADSFTNKFGTYRGGYVPAMVDGRIVKDNELKRLMEEGKEGMSYAFPGTSKGFTQKRTEYNKPMLLDLRTLPMHIDKVLKFTHLENPVRDVAKLLNDKQVSTPLNTMQPATINGMLQPWLTRAASQQVTTPMVGLGGLSKLFNTLRNRTGMATMFANLSNTAQQITGFALAGVVVKPSHLLSATASYMKSPRQTSALVASLSTYMDGRINNEVSALLGEVESILLDPNVYESAVNWSKRHQYFMQSAVDNVMGPIIWMGAYNQALEENFDTVTAARQADAAIRQTQGSTMPEDVSRAETGPAYLRLFTQFASYFNMQANLLGSSFSKIPAELGMRQKVGRGFYIGLMGFAIPAILAEAIAQGFRGGPGDDDKDGEYLDDWLMSLLVYGPMRNVTAFVPGLGQLVNSTVARFTDNPLDDRISVGAAVAALERSAAVPNDLYKLAIGEGKAEKTLRDVGTLATLVTGLPIATLAKPAAYVAGVVEGATSPTSNADFARGVVSGTASRESRP